MYKRFFSHLSEQSLLYQTQFSFQLGDSTEHAKIHLIDQIDDKMGNDYLL